MTDTTKPARPELGKKAPAKAAAKTKPTAAADESVHPVDVQRPEKPAVPRARRRESTVQLGTRVAEDVANMVADEALRRGVTQRQVLEELIRANIAG